MTDSPLSPLPPLRSSMGAAVPSLESVSRPLLNLVQYISGMETSFVTSIDWDAQRQDVLFTLNTGALQIPERSTTDWNDSMCRSMFLSGQAASHAVGDDVPATINAIAAGMKSFVAVPILDGDITIGTVCGASHRTIELSEAQVAALQCVADALQQLLQAELGKSNAQARAALAEADARRSRDVASQQAIDFQRMEKLAHTDELTGLPNRRAFVSRWEDALARSGRRHAPIGVLLIDVDRFKDINDTLGHLVGDAVLGAIGATLRQTAQTQDLIARLGGDEFAMCISHASSDALLDTARQIRERFALAIVGLGVGSTLSIGIAHSDDCPRQHLLGSADKALYRSKAAGGDRATVFANEF